MSKFDIDKTLARLNEGVLADRVVATGFLEPELAAQLASRLRQRDISVHLSGGFAGARRRVLTAFPEHIPEATTKLSALYSPEAQHDSLRTALENHGIAADNLGDTREYQEGAALVLLHSVVAKALTLEKLEGKPVTLQEISLDYLASGKSSRLQVIVPSLRVDALGAKAFKKSRSYFTKGIAGGKVSLNGVKAGKSASAEVGDEIYAEGLGRAWLLEVQGTTKKGNFRTIIEVETV